MKYPKLRELKEAITALIKGPVTTKFPAEPHTPPEGFRGRPAPSDEGCIACGACAEVCPSGAIKVIEKVSGAQTPSRVMEWRYDECIFCGQCERYCTTRNDPVCGVKLNLEFDLSGVDRSKMRASVEKELVVCDNCGEILSSRRHLEWIAGRLGPLSSANFGLNELLGRNILNTKGVAGVSIDTGAVRRQDLFQVNCPKCRHAILVFNQTGKNQAENK